MKDESFHARIQRASHLHPSAFILPAHPKTLAADRSASFSPAPASRDRRPSSAAPPRCRCGSPRCGTPSSTSSHVTGIDTPANGVGTDGVDRRQRAAPGVLVVVDEHAAVRALGLAVLGGDDVGMARLELAGRSPSRTSTPPSASARARSGCRRECPSSRWSSDTSGIFSCAEDVAHAQRDLADAREVRARDRDRDRSAGSRGGRYRRSARTTD